MLLPSIGFADSDRLKVLFLGDHGHHTPRERFGQLAPVMSDHGIDLEFTDSIQDLNRKTLSGYDALLIYANIEQIEPDEERAVIEFVEAGGGFVPIHCASYCFLNSSAMIELIGAQFQRHGTGVFRVESARPDHPVMKGFGGFESWDETYLHHRHNPENEVLEYRVEGTTREPWTWVRNVGKGRVFYTAWGHDERTWSNPGFLNLVERGIRWASGKDPAVAGTYLADRPFPVPEMTALPEGNSFEYDDVGGKIPNYVPSAQWGSQGEPLSLMQRPLPAEESIKRFVTPTGFEVKLFAAEPDLVGKPITMTWDHKGRLIVAETVDYPNELKVDGNGRDRIRICEDSDGDGRADRFTLFAEGLSIPTAIVEARGGFIVQSGTQTLFLKDTDGDDRADVRSVLIDGWNVDDTHGGVSNFHYGLDNWVWGMQGYNPSEPVVEGRKQPSFRMGFFRFRLSSTDPPTVEELEFVRSTDNNTWGLGISEEGLIFGSTANHNPSVFMPIPNRYYERVRGWTKSLTLHSIADTHLFRPITDKVRQVDHFGGYTAGAGHAVYTARRYPREYWNRAAFVNGPTGHLVGTFVLTPKGSNYASTSPFNLLASDDEWSAPIMAEVGPDGNVWVLDWYNYIVQHNPTPRGFETGKGRAYETDLRDQKHGRVYRVVFGQEDRHDSSGLDGASTGELVHRLTDPTMLWRLHAQRLLVERKDQAALPALLELIADREVDEIGLNVGALHALWTLQGLGIVSRDRSEVAHAIAGALQHPSAGVRRAAIQVLPADEESSQALLDAGVLWDGDAQVRLAAFLRLSELPPIPAVGAKLVSLMTRPSHRGDSLLADAVTCAAAQNSMSFLGAMIDSQKPSDELTAMTEVVAHHVARGNDRQALASVLGSLAGADPAVLGALVRGANAGWPEDQPLADAAGVNEFVAKSIGRLAGPDRGLMLQLARRWGSDSIAPYLKSLREAMLAEVDDASLDPLERVKSAEQYVSLDPADPESAATILKRITPQTPPELALGWLRSLGQSESPAVGEHLIENFAQFTPAMRRESIGVLLSRPSSTLAVVNALGNGLIQWNELSLDQRQLLTEHPNALVKMTARAILARGGALPNPDRQRVIEELLPTVSEPGDAVAGRLAFRKHCAKCHQHSGEGERIGPDLTGMAAHTKAELLTQILDPSRSVEGNFQTYSVVTSDGRLLSGIVTAESQTTIELLDAEGKRQTLLREDIDELSRSTKSLMPEGFEKQASESELRDLLTFLTQRGRYLPLELSKVATISSARGMFQSESATVERLIVDEWGPRTVADVPFLLVDPRDGEVRNVILLQSPRGAVCQAMPRSVTIPCHGPVKAVHLLSGVSGWGYPAISTRSTSLIVRLHFADGSSEDHPLVNGEHFADYIRRVDVPGSTFAFPLREQQIRYLAVAPMRPDPVESIEFLKGDDETAPVILAVTIE